MKRLLAVALFLAVDASSALGQAARPLARGASVSDSLPPGSAHTFTIRLAAGQFVYGEADQLTVDVVVTVTDPTGERVGRWDGPARGPETFQFDTESEGDYRIEVAPFRGGTGRYTLAIKRVEPTATQPEARVDQLMARFSGDVPGGVVGVIRGGHVAFAKGYGMANLTHGIPFTADIPSNIGSVSKQFTAFAISLLADRGKLSVDDDVRTYIPELPAFDHPVTIRNLLNHTGGYRELYNTMPITGWRGEDALPRSEAVHIVQRQPALQTPPGSEFNYNNTGYILLAEIVTRVTGTPFPRWMDANVFGPLGMTHTTIRADRGQVVPHAAQGYVPVDSGGYREAGDLDASYGAGGIYTTVGDLAKWLRNFHAPTVGNADIIARMTTRAVLTGGDTIAYGRGLAIGERHGLRLINHGGADVAHRAMLMYFPEIDAGVVTLSNNASFPASVAGEVADAFFDDRMTDDPEEEEPREPGAPVHVAPELLDRYAGRYQAEGVPLTITYARDGERFYADPSGQPQLDLVAESDSVFRYEGVDATVTFHVEGDTVQRATHHQGGRDLPLERLPPWAPGAADLTAFAGRYYSAELETFYTLVVKDSVLVARHRLLDDIALTPKEPDAFTGGAFFFGDVVFERDDQGLVTGFRVSNGRTRDVLFERAP